MSSGHLLLVHQVAHAQRCRVTGSGCFSLAALDAPAPRGSHLITNQVKPVYVYGEKKRTRKGPMQM